MHFGSSLPITTAEPDPWHCFDKKDWRSEQAEIQMCPADTEEQAGPRDQNRHRSEPRVIRQKQYTARKIIRRHSKLTWGFLHTSYWEWTKPKLWAAQGSQVYQVSGHTWGRGGAATTVEEILSQSLSNSPHILSWNRVPSRPGKHGGGFRTVVIKDPPEPGSAAASEFSELQTSFSAMSLNHQKEGEVSPL